MGTKIVYTFLSMFIIAAAAATDISFVVYNVSGSVSKNSKQKIKKGDKLLASDAIVVAEKASVILVCSNYKVIQINKKGTYTAKALLSDCNKTSAGYSSSYFKYVWDEFTHPHGKPETDPGKYMKNVGAVSRGCNTVATGVMVDTLIVGKGNLPLYWNSSFTKSILAIYDVAVDGAPLQKTILETNVPINFEQVSKSLLPGEYYWQIINEEGNSCERNFLKLLDSSTYQQQVDALIHEIPFTTKAETAFAKAFVLQENHYVAAAIEYYTIAAKLQPNNKLYQKTLSTFYATKF